MSEEKRQYRIYLLCFFKRSALAISDFQSLLNVSRNTVLSDIKKLRQQLDSENIRLEYSRRVGVYLEGASKE